LACLGFGHIEIGTVTLRPQPGNPKPRLFRLPAEKALINRLGFPGLGAEFVIKEIKKPRPERLVLGVNLGKNKDTPLESAAEDYQELLRIFAPHADYLTINISSPNTEGLRSLQQKQALEHLLRQINSERKRISQTLLKRPPILIKLSPDLSDLELEDALDVILSNNMDGIIATNTTLCREGLVSHIATETGGLSGVPLFSSSLELVRKIALHVGQALPIIGVGGINNATGVIQMLDAGATLVQIYTGLIYEGPGLVKRILQELQKN
jgi:dihydroorotate dehydrogenase